jgi:hypothetical protein
MRRRGPHDDTLEYTDRTLTQARLEKDYISSDVRGTLWVILLAFLVIGLGVLLMWLVL